MELYDLINIQGKDNETELEKCIVVVKEQLKDLTEDRTCKIYNGLLYQELVKSHVTAKLVNTKDIGLPYEHVFILIPMNRGVFYLADLTYSQFRNQNPNFVRLLMNGYQKVDNRLLNQYIRIVEPKDIDKTYDIDSIYFNKM